MAVEVQEKFESRDINKTQDTVMMEEIWTVKGVFNTLEADQYGPSMNDIRVVGAVKISVQRKFVEVIAPDACRITVNFGTPPGSQSSDSVTGETWEMDQTATTEHITHVRSAGYQVSYPSQENVGKAIGVTPAGDVQGVDIFSPSTKLTIRKTWPASFIKKEYFDVIRELTGKVNFAVFKGFESTDVMFLGARMTNQATGYVPAVYHFLVGERREDLEFDLVKYGKTPIDQKAAWDYLWLMNIKEKKEGAKNSVENGIKSVHVAKVYDEGDFNKLQLSPEL